MGFLPSKRANQKCVICGNTMTDKSPVGDLCVACFQQCVNMSGILRYLQNTTLDNLNIIQNAAVHPVSVMQQPVSEWNKEDEASDVQPPEQPSRQIRQYSIVRKKTGERYILFDKVTKIGKSPEMANIVLKDNNTLSRCHAVLEKTAQGVLLSDCGSKNGTRYGGGKLAEGQKILLHNGDVFLLSNETMMLVCE